LREIIPSDEKALSEIGTVLMMWTTVEWKTIELDRNHMIGGVGLMKIHQNIRKL
jgi:hypothetical protein